MSFTSDLCERLFPFKSGNKIWVVQLLKVYLMLMVVCLIIASIIYGVMNKEWKERDEDEEGHSFSNILWWTFCAFHSLSFGDLTPVGPFDRALGCLVAFLGYHFAILAVSVVVLS